MSVSTVALARVKEGGEMTETHEHLLALITQNGQKYLTDLLEVGSTEIHRKCMGETGFTLRHLAMIFDAMGVKLAGESDVVLERSNYEALTRIASGALSNQVQSFDGVQRRKKA